VSAKALKFTPAGLCVLLLATAGCTPTGGASDAEVAELRTLVEQHSLQIAGLQEELRGAREELEKKNSSREMLRVDREERLTELRERRERRRTPDLVDPFAATPKEMGDPTPLPLPHQSPSSRADPEALTTLVDSIKCEEGACSMSATALTSVLNDPSALMRSARVVPRVKDGVSEGFKLYGVRSRSLPKALGIKNGDTVVSLDGEPLGTLDQALATYAKLSKKLKAKKSFVLVLERKGKLHSLKLSFV
jgi:sRNA-binding protein